MHMCTVRLQLIDTKFIIQPTANFHKCRLFDIFASGNKLELVRVNAKKKEREIFWNRIQSIVKTQKVSMTLCVIFSHFSLLFFGSHCSNLLSVRLQFWKQLFRIMKTTPNAFISIIICSIGRLCENWNENISEKVTLINDCLAVCPCKHVCTKDWAFVNVCVRWWHSETNK